jgi:hypothetical protein
MDRRTFLRAGMAGTATGAAALAGCSSLFSVQAGGVKERMPPLPENRPKAVYYPTHIEGMKMAGMASTNTNSSSGRGEQTRPASNDTNNSTSGQQTNSAGYKCALTYSYPHRFWTVTGNRTKKVTIENGDSLHLMVSVWDPETNIYPMDANPTITVSKNGDSVTTVSPWTMLSQNMGFHAGDNVPLPGAGDYSVTVDVPPTSARRTGAFEGQFSSQQSFEFELTYDPQKMSDIMFKKLEEKAGTRGAVAPMEMKKMPLALAPKKSALPGRLLGTTRTGDGVFVMTTLGDASRFGAAEKTYLAVSARTPYNRYILPAMSLSAQVKRGKKTVFNGPLQATLDPKLNYHYGATVESIEAGDKITLAADAPPQVARHEGYETAFLDMPSKTLTVGRGTTRQ